MYLFIFESIGTSELLLIGIIALIFLGPRKLPQMAKTIGRTMSDFRRTTNEFKSTWEREVDLESFNENEIAPPAPVARVTPVDPPLINPEVRQLDEEAARKLKESTAETPVTPTEASQPETVSQSDKRSWL